MALSHPPAETFVPSKASALGKSKKYSWIGFVAGAVAAFAIYGFSWFALGLILLVAGFFEWLIRQQLSVTRGVVTLDAEGLTAQSLGGPTKKFAWRDLETVSVESGLLTFHLSATPDRPDRRSFWTGGNPAKPTLNLVPFEEADQERLLDTIRRYQSLAKGDDPAGNILPNELAAEREFRERLTALAPRTWATWALIGINVLIWVYSLTIGGQLAGTPADKLLLWGGNAASEVQKGEWWRMLAAIFMHSGVMHVGMNMLGLYLAGTLVERIYGARLFLIIYFGAGLLGSAFSLHFSALHAVSVGASGAVFGVTGALLVAVLQHRDKLPETFSKQMIVGVCLFVGHSLLQGFANVGIDNAAHIGGLIGGALAAFILPERFDAMAFRKVMLRRAVAALAVMIVATVSVAALAPPAALDQAKVVASGQQLGQLFKEFARAMKVLQDENEAVKAGRLSDDEADQRSRSVHAPMMRNLQEKFSQVVLRPGDPREPIVRDMQRTTQLMTEALSMDSVRNESTGKMDPADPQRAAQINAELPKILERLKALVEKAKAAK